MNEINTWPGWKCVCKLGKGAFGNVYEIHRVEAGKIYKAALKVITIPQDQSEVQNAYSEGMTKENVTTYFESVVNDFRKEFALMDELKGYTNIVSYEDHMVVKHENGIGWDILIRMELLTPLLRWIDEYPMDEKMVIKLGCDICTALELCHKNTIIHRDIKPENIFVNKNGDFKLGDFGIARVTEKTSSVMSQKGTGPYMAPEVDKGEKYNETVDIYSLGIVLYRFLNNHRTPFLPMGQITHNDRKVALDKRLSGEPIPAPMHGSDKLKMVVLRAIQYDPSKRFQNAKSFKNALQHLVDNRKDITKDITKDIPEDNNVTEDKTQKIQNLGENDFPEEEDVTIRKKRVIIPQKKEKKWIFPVCLLGLVCMIAVATFFLVESIDKNVVQTSVSKDMDKQEQKETVVIKEKQVEQHSEESDNVIVDLNYAKAVAEFLIANITGFSSDEMQFYVDLRDDELNTILDEKEIPINAGALKNVFSQYLKNADTLGEYVSTGNHKFKKYVTGAKNYTEINFLNYSTTLAISFNNEGIVTSGSFRKEEKNQIENIDVPVENSNTEKSSEFTEDTDETGENEQKLINVVSVVGMPEQEAIETLENQGLSVNSYTTGSITIEPGYVCIQHTEPGTLVEPGSSILIGISSSKEYRWRNIDFFNIDLEEETIEEYMRWNEEHKADYGEQDIDYSEYEVLEQRENEEGTTTYLVIYNFGEWTEWTRDNHIGPYEYVNDAIKGIPATYPGVFLSEGFQVETRNIE